MRRCLKVAKIKAVFDADILFHIVKTGCQFHIKQLIAMIYIADYVYNQEIKKGTKEGKAIQTLEDMKIVKVLYEKDLDDHQRIIYKDAINILNS